jgi:hypothetical protein
MQGIGGAKIFSICGTPTYGDTVQAFVDWAEANPREWQDGRSVGLITALSKKANQDGDWVPLIQSRSQTRPSIPKVILF